MSEESTRDGNKVMAKVVASVIVSTLIAQMVTSVFSTRDAGKDNAAQLAVLDQRVIALTSTLDEIKTDLRNSPKRSDYEGLERRLMEAAGRLEKTDIELSRRIDNHDARLNKLERVVPIPVTPFKN